MAQDINIQMKHFNGADFDNIYPKTKSGSIIDLNDNYYNKVQSESIFLSKSGGTMTGPIVLSSDPVENLQAATKQYVDVIANGKIIFGSYQGTGSYGASAPCKIVFNGNPIIIWLYGMYKWYDGGLASGYHFENFSFYNSNLIIQPSLLTDSYTIREGFYDANSGNSSYAKKSGGAVYWFNELSASIQFNSFDSGKPTIYYYAIFY